MIDREGHSEPRASWRARRVTLRALLGCVALCAWQGHAGAQERAAARGTPAPQSASAPRTASAPRSRVVTISEVTIVGRIQKPIAAVDVSRIQPKLTLAELRQPFLQGIEKAIYGSPF
jgi:hypothetical protein